MGKKRRYVKKIFKPKTPVDLILRAEIAEERAEELRINITKAEERIMGLLDELKMEYVFQFPKFDEWFFLIADFYLPNIKLIIEVDGPIGHSGPMAIRREKKRLKWLRSQGIDVIRIKNKSTEDLTAIRLKKIIEVGAKIKKRYVL